MTATLYTIGFTGKSAQEFFGIIQTSQVKKVVDVRLKNVSQLAGFAKRDDLRFFLRSLCGCDYEHRPEWAPTEELLEGFKKKRIGWDEYERGFAAVLDQRLCGGDIASESLSDVCLLCSEPTADHCHRRLLAERFQTMCPGLAVRHL